MSHNYTGHDTHIVNIEQFFFLMFFIIITLLCCNCLKNVRIITQPAPLYVDYDVYGTLNNELDSTDTDSDSDSATSLDVTYNILPEEKLLEECCICQEKLYNFSTIRLMCDHMFHEKCYKEWLKNNKECCLCRNKSRIKDYFLPIENIS